MKYLLLTLLFSVGFCIDQKELAREAIVEAGKRLYAQKNLYPLRARRWVSGEVRKVGLTLQYCAESDVAKARELLILTAETLLSTVNQKKDLRPYLGKYPFDFFDLDVEILFKKSSYDDVSPGTLSKIVLENGKFRYYIDTGISDKLVKDEIIPHSGFKVN